MGDDGGGFGAECLRGDIEIAVADDDDIVSKGSGEAEPTEDAENDDERHECRNIALIEDLHEHHVEKQTGNVVDEVTNLDHEGIEFREETPERADEQSKKGVDHRDDKGDL